MYKHDYEEKMTTLVSDKQTYKHVLRDPTNSIQTKTNSIIQRMKTLKLIDTQTAKYLTTYNGTCPRIYGQPKAHKLDLPLRPVVPTITAPTYRLNKHIADILQTSIISHYSISSSFEFCDYINDIQLPDNYIIASLDVISLFTNVPHAVVISNIIARWKEINTDINLDLFLEIVEFCMEASYFQYQGKFYYQTFGTAMGSPLSPILADIVLDSIIDRALHILPFPVPIIRKYVDDLFIAIPRDTAQEVLNAFNAQEPRLQFTIEVENNCSLPYLDMTVKRLQNNCLITEWYAKPIATGRLLHYHSFHQLKHKINEANNFIHRVKYLTRTQAQYGQNHIIKNNLTINGYPKTLVNRLINQYQRKNYIHSQQQQAFQNATGTHHMPSKNTAQPHSTQPIQHQASYTGPSIDQFPPQDNITSDSTTFNERDEQNINNRTNLPAVTDFSNQIDQQQVQQKFYRSITYLPKLTNGIIACLKKEYFQVKISSKIQKSVKVFHSQVKDPLKHLEKSKVVYKVPCADCSACYIGITKNKLSERLAGHKSDINKMTNYAQQQSTDSHASEQKIAYKTALIEHCANTKHSFDLNNTSIVDHSHNTYTLPFLEMCHIKNTTNTVNKRGDTEGLHSAYAAIMRTLQALYGT